MTADRDGKEDVQSVAALLATLDALAEMAENTPYALARVAWEMELGGKLRNAWPTLRAALTASLAEGGAGAERAKVIEECFIAARGHGIEPGRYVSNYQQGRIDAALDVRALSTAGGGRG